MAVQSAQILSQDELAAKLAEQPRVELGTFPTPLDSCPRLSEAVGGPPIYIKRDDLTGLALGGNKTRNLEFQIGSALAQGCDSVVAGADTQSNQCRQAAAACAKVGAGLFPGALRRSPHGGAGQPPARPHLWGGRYRA